jgi:benzoyl-CoA reductase/2-hydroxyglutaryl-CoA dehydratase subunit BcrC/BadD/HgdB
MPSVQFTSRQHLKETMTAYYRGLGAAAKDHSAPVAWCTSVGPAELLRALGFEVHFPENHGAMLGASRQANEVMPRAHALGYSPDICSYLCSDVGAYLAGRTPLERFGLEEVPRADVLVFNTNQCHDVRHWFEFFGREWDVPVLGVTSFRDVDTVTDSLVDAVARQFEDLVPPLERIAGARLSSSRLEEVMRLSCECTLLWKDCLEAAAHRPSPLSFFDGCIHMGPAVVLRGTQAACDYYEVLRDELTERRRRGVAAVAGEQFRLYWDGMPIWGKLRDLSNLLERLGACVVASTYCNSWIFEALDPADPFRSLARASLELFIARAESPKERSIERMVDLYQVDGILFHDARTCPNNSNTRYGMPARLRERLRVPVLTIDGDLNDLRCYSEEQSKTSIEGFVEQLAER